MHRSRLKVEFLCVVTSFDSGLGLLKSSLSIDVSRRPRKGSTCVRSNWIQCLCFEATLRGLVYTCLALIGFQPWRTYKGKPKVFVDKNRKEKKIENNARTTINLSYSHAAIMFKVWYMDTITFSHQLKSRPFWKDDPNFNFKHFPAFLMRQCLLLSDRQM